LPVSGAATAKAADFRTVLRSQSGAFHTALSSHQSNVNSPANKSRMLSGSFVRNQDSRAAANIPPSGSETSSVSTPASQTLRLQAATTTTADTTPTPTPVAAPAFFAGTNIPIQNPFGPDPYMSNPTQNIFAANDGTAKMIPQSLAAYYFPTQQTAQTVAQLFGGTVFTEAPDPGNPFTLNQPRYMVRLANGTEINPGIISHFYDTRSDTPFQLQQLVQDVLNGGTMCTLQPNNGGYGPQHGTT
jgi:hypothetical protein